MMDRLVELLRHERLRPSHSRPVTEDLGLGLGKRYRLSLGQASTRISPGAAAQSDFLHGGGRADSSHSRSQQGSFQDLGCLRQYWRFHCAH